VSKQRVLFLCTHNSARSQMAEGLLRHLAGDRFEVASAGTVATLVRPLAVKVMNELGVDISGHESKTLDRYLLEPGTTSSPCATTPMMPALCFRRQAAASLVVPRSLEGDRYRRGADGNLPAGSRRYQDAHRRRAHCRVDLASGAAGAISER